MNVKRTAITLVLFSATLLVALYFLRTPGALMDPSAPAQSVSHAPNP